MILREIPFQTFDDELGALSRLSSEDVSLDYLDGARDALLWLRNGAPRPSELLSV